MNKGFSPSTGNLSTTRASQTDFKNADGYDVLYWSSHGNSTPMLNLGDSQSQFNSYSAAYSAWNSTSDKLKVAILAACHQLDGATNRSQWASIMRRSNTVSYTHLEAEASPIQSRTSSRESRACSGCACIHQRSNFMRYRRWVFLLKPRAVR